MKRLLIVGSVGLSLFCFSSVHGQSLDDPVDSSSGVELLEVTPAPLDATLNSTPTTQLSATRAATQPEASSATAGNFPTIAGSYGLSEFVDHFAPYYPMYFIGGTQTPNIKFQFSIRYRILNPTGPLAKEDDWLKGFNIAYTQTSLWNITKPDVAFFDTGYKPEFFYYLENSPLALPPSWQLGAQGGVGHESNGLADPNHRSINMVFIRPIFTISNSGANALFLTIAPKIYAYVGGVSLNPDIARYRGHADIQITLGQRDGLQLSTLARVGSSFNQNSEQFDLTYPLTKLLGGNLDISLDAQYFNGYGETLLTYNKRTSIFRMGLCILR